ncbi:MAG: threonine--tRNA ligase [Candidatus Ryanbacteria bacterium]|nr:threonine--tRNA ligase [Candidatus Ryanbacteria bacterium]
MNQELSDNDHRVIGQKLDLFSFHEIAPGAPFWHGHGMIIWRELEKYIRKLNDREGYEETSTPVLVKTQLFEKSGHWQHFKDNMFWFKNPRDENEELGLKPMNCPESTLIYSTQIRSYRDLPLRLSEVSDKLHRNELSGTLGGLLRVRQMTQDDAHIYCRPDQIESEITTLMTLVKEFYSNFDFALSFNLATRPDKAMGDTRLWQEAEKDLENVLKNTGVKYEIKEKDGAFYGPKIDINVTDSQNREWTIATIQLDFQIPERMGLEYVDESGKNKRPVMIHRAILGTFERFIGILLEHTSGALPFWLAPVQVRVLTINEKVSAYAEKVVSQLKEKNIRVELDSRNETINKKIREGEMQKIPYLVVVGEKEMADKTLNIRTRGVKETSTQRLENFLKSIVQ